jgi:hypothetical protein
VFFIFIIPDREYLTIRVIGQLYFYRSGTSMQRRAIERSNISERDARIPSALKALTLAPPAGRLPNHDGRTDFVVFVSEIRA